MIIINKKNIIKGLIALLVVLLIAAFSLGIGLLEAWLIHRYYPDPENYYPIRYWPMFSVPEEGYAIHIDLDTLILTLYKDGDIYKTWPVSGGAKSTPSPLGLWKVNGISHWGEGFGGSWISINVPWGKYGIHGTYEPWEVGRKNSSHGCIRMKNADVKELKQYVRWGTLVYIKQSDVPFRALKDGKIGSDVLEVQEMLLELGFYKGMPDGRYGAGTIKAVKEFQRSRGAKADGIVGWHTLNLLQEACG